MELLGIDVSDDEFARWREWFAPASQLFCIDQVPETARQGLDQVDPDLVPMEIKDTFMAYSGSWVLLDEPSFQALTPQVRSALIGARPRGFRTVWWPERLAAVGDGPLLRYIRDGVTPSEHKEVPQRIWDDLAHVLPDAQRLAGTFATRSGPNCFGTVMAAAGVEGAEDVWMTQPPFEDWLQRHTTAISGTSHDYAPGTVLVWRNDESLALHALVTLGDGWALNKPSQAWCAPRFVWPLRRAIYHSRRAGARVHRYAITD